jgi:hypothetical protein
MEFMKLKLTCGESFLIKLEDWGEDRDLESCLTVAPTPRCLECEVEVEGKLAKDGMVFCPAKVQLVDLEPDQYYSIGEGETDKQES